ncbi:MAG: class I SAM-dependent methyltransferase [Chloroflexi bacterium]|nr:class I SAM-dependent methyltransferase [Chloroflexota bacterium]
MLDVACGLGALLMFAEGKGLRTYGLDISSKGIEIARLNTPKSGLIQGTGEVLPYRDGVFDYVTCIGSLEHMLHAGLALQEMWRVGASGGKLCLLVPNAHFLGAYRNLFRKAETYQQLTGQLYERMDTLGGGRKLIEGGDWRIQRVHRENHTRMRPHFSARQIMRLLLNPVLPARLSYGLVFICEKRDA